MTAAERAVLAVYPEAECWRVNDQLGGGYDVVVYQRELGIGPTPRAAWADAAPRLPDPGVARTAPGV